MHAEVTAALSHLAVTGGAGSFTLTSSTAVGNFAGGAGCGFAGANSIVAGNVGLPGSEDCAGGTRLGHNRIGVACPELRAQASDRLGSEARLPRLHARRPGGDPAAARRRRGDLARCDIGAREADPPASRCGRGYGLAALLAPLALVRPRRSRSPARG